MTGSSSDGSVTFDAVEVQRHLSLVPAAAVDARGLVYFPDVIQTSEDSPVLLSRLTYVTDDPDEPVGDSGITIVAINGIDVTAEGGASLPGVRVGEGSGAGYVFRRDLDGQLVFSPDFGFSGVTAFTYTVADALGESATLVATLSVQPSLDDTTITFVDGSQAASVADCIDTAILGALSFDWPSLGDDPVTIQVFEGDADTPSDRFSVIGDKLQLVGGVDRGAEETIALRIIASVDGLEVAAGAFEIEVRAWNAEGAGDGDPDTFLFTKGPTLVYSAPQTRVAAADRLPFEALAGAAIDEDVDADTHEPYLIDAEGDAAQAALDADVATIPEPGVLPLPTPATDVPEL